MSGVRNATIIIPNILIIKVSIFILFISLSTNPLQGQRPYGYKSSQNTLNLCKFLLLTVKNRMSENWHIST
jgi:hypothetical protein